MTVGTRTGGADATSARTSGATSSNATSNVTSTPPPPTADNGVDTHTSEESSGLPNECCLPHGAPGCADAGVQMCVCEFESDCCEHEGGWNQDCVELVDVLGCGDCGVPAEVCCQFPGPPNCGVPVVDNCVCELDPFCCDLQGGWDLHCVALAVTECGSYCPAPFGNCCEPGQHIGCDDWDVVACVCSAAVTAVPSNGPKNPAWSWPMPASSRGATSRASTSHAGRARNPEWSPGRLAHTPRVSCLRSVTKRAESGARSVLHVCHHASVSLAEASVLAMTIATAWVTGPTEPSATLHTQADATVVVPEAPEWTPRRSIPRRPRSPTHSASIRGDLSGT